MKFFQCYRFVKHLIFYSAQNRFLRFFLVCDVVGQSFFPYFHFVLF